MAQTKDVVKKSLAAQQVRKEAVQLL